MNLAWLSVKLVLGTLVANMISFWQIMSWTSQRRRESQHLNFRNRYLWLWVWIAIRVALPTAQPHKFTVDTECKHVSVNPVSLRKLTCAFLVLQCLNMLCPCYMKMTVLNCALSCLFEGSERLQIQSLFSFPVLLIKGSMHPWDRWLRMEFINWMLPICKAYARQSGDMEGLVWIQPPEKLLWRLSCH